MNILMMMLRSMRPSRISDMRAIAKPFWIKKGYDGLTFFGHIITHTQQEAESFNACHISTFKSKKDQYNVIKNHEMIHLYQARATHDSWLCFYWKYIVFWLRASRYRKHLRDAGYLLNPFEMEAYANMYNLHYLDDKENGTNEWRRYAEMSLEQRYQAYLARNRSA